MVSIPSWLLSNFSPETLSWVGFKLLLIALAGEAGVALLAIISKKDLLHKEIAFALAIIAAGSYAIERIGDDAIIESFTKRATTAESAFARLKAPRTLDAKRQQFIADAVRLWPNQRYRVSISQAADDGPDFWHSLYIIYCTQIRRLAVSSDGGRDCHWRSARWYPNCGNTRR